MRAEVCCLCCGADGDEHCRRPRPGGLLLGPFQDCCECSDGSCQDCHPDPATIASRAAQAGHDLESDPPAALTSMRRWTCRTCGDAVLLRPDGSAYGGATERTCEQSLAFWKGSDE